MQGNVFDTTPTSYMGLQLHSRSYSEDIEQVTISLILTLIIWKTATYLLSSIKIYLEKRYEMI